jgi:Predicted membrane protein
MSTRTKESKKIASYSLIIMGLGYLITIWFEGPVWGELLHGGFEAGLVGGLADWFAVTALFRHPLGLPIPRTALIPNNRKRITNALVSMLKNDWLSKESIQEKINHIAFTEKLIAFIKVQMQTISFRKSLIRLIKKMIHWIDVERLTPVIKKQIISTLSNVEMKKLIQSISSQLLNEKFDEKVLDHLLKKADSWLRQEQTVHRLGTVSMNLLNNIQADGMLQFALKSIQSLLSKERIGKIVQNLLLNIIQSLQIDGEPNRQALVSYIRKEIHGMGENEQLIEGVENWKHQLLSKWEPDQTITESLQQLQQKTLDFVDDSDFMDHYLMPLLDRFLEMIQEDQNNIDLWMRKQIAEFVENNHSKIGNLVQENLDKLDTETLVDMMENNVGKDLQWIRVNGAVCGFIIGIFLTGIQILVRLA